MTQGTCAKGDSGGATIENTLKMYMHICAFKNILVVKTVLHLPSLVSLRGRLQTPDRCAHMLWHWGSTACHSLCLSPRTVRLREEQPSSLMTPLFRCKTTSSPNCRNQFKNNPQKRNLKLPKIQATNFQNKSVFQWKADCPRTSTQTLFLFL